MKPRLALITCTLFALAASTGTACAGGLSVDDDQVSNPARYCELVHEIDDRYEAADDRPLDNSTRWYVDELVGSLSDLVPAAYTDSFRLRYWPFTDTAGLDTSGVSAQRAYDRMADLHRATCGT